MKPKKQFKVNARVKSVAKHRPKAHFEKDDMKAFEILGGKAHVVELPEGVDRLLVFNDERPYLSYFVGTDTHCIYLPVGNWQIVGMLPEINNELAANLVELPQYGHFFNYAYNNPAHKWLRTAIESFESAIVAEGYYLDENPKRIKDHDSFYDGNGRLKDEEWYMIKCEAEAEAQPRVLCGERTLILRRI